MAPTVTAKPTTRSPNTAAPTKRPTPLPKPNVVLIIADDYRALSTSFQRLAVAPITPNIEKLLRKSVRFMNAHSQMSICGPSRASFLTSLRPDSLRVWDIDRQDALNTRIENALRFGNRITMTLPRLFKSNGYVTYGMGKIYHENEDAQMQDPKSWSEPVFTWKSPYMRAPSFSKPYDGMWINSANVNDNYYSDGQLGQMAVDRLSSLMLNPTQPFFLAVGFWKPHLPWTAPEKYFAMQGGLNRFTVAHHGGSPTGMPTEEFQMIKGQGCGEANQYPGAPEPLAGWSATPDQERTAQQAYYATVSYMDAQVGRILTRIESSPVANHTIVVLMGDHGFHLGDHGLYCKHTNFEQGTRTALSIMAPIRDRSFDVTRGKPYVGPVELVDVMPTLAVLTGLPTTGAQWEAWQGVSLVPAMRNPAVSVKWGAVSQYFRGRGDTKRWGYSIRTTRYRFTWWCLAPQQFNMGGRNCNPIELYDYMTDRYEQRSLVGRTDLRTVFRTDPVRWQGELRFNTLQGAVPFDWTPEVRAGMAAVYAGVAEYP